MTTWIFVMCILHPAGYCAEVTQEPVATQAECAALVERYRNDRRVIVYCTRGRS